MAYETLKEAIREAIWSNGNYEISGDLLQTQLISMINSLGAGYQFMGIATPTTDPGTPDQKIFYLASQDGTYPNFGGISIENEVAILQYDTTWHKLDTGIKKVTISQNIETATIQVGGGTPAEVVKAQAGKELSDNNYTDAEKTKLASLNEEIYGKTQETTTDITEQIVAVTPGRVYKNNTTGVAPLVAEYQGMKGLVLDATNVEKFRVIGSAGNSYRLWAKVKNGVIISCANYISGVQDVNILCDGTFDQLVVNVVTSGGTAYNLYKTTLTQDGGVIQEIDKIFPNHKKIIMCGDSQIANAPRLEKELKALLSSGNTVLNCGFAGCRMSKYTGGVQANNSFSMVAIADALSSGDWTFVESGLSTYPSYEANVNKLKGVDMGDGDGIIMTIAYGGNDFKDGALLGTAVDNEYTLIGAMQYCINTLLTAFPKLQIIFVGLPYRVYDYSGATIILDSDTYTKEIGGESFHRYDYSDAILNNAKANHLPCFDMYRRCGRNKYNVFAICADGVHPSTTYGQRLTAELYAKMLRDF